MTDLNNYRNILVYELESRQLRNPRYSLRSFARDLGLSPSRLSDVIRGRYGLSREAAVQIAQRLGFEFKESQRFADLVDSEHARSKRRKNAAKSRIFQSGALYSQLTLDQFRVISDWYHYALLELISLEDFQNDLNWIASTLGVKPDQIESAIERLKRLGLLTEVKGKLRVSSENSSTPDGLPSDAIRKFHHQILDLAHQAIDVQSVEERDFSSMILAVEKAQIPEAKAMIREFRRSFDQKFGNSRNKKDEVYGLAIQLIRLSGKGKKK